MIIITDIDRINFIEERARFIRIGISFIWDGTNTYQYGEYADIKGEGETIRQAIDQAIEKNRNRSRKK